MSFSVTVTGTVEEIKAKLQEECSKLTAQSLSEFEAVKPALETILDQNVGQQRLSLEANGHAAFDGNTKTSGQCSVSIKAAPPA
jgi:hypothetical protein